MDTMQILSVVVFLAVMAAIVTEKIHRTVAAVAGGAVAGLSVNAGLGYAVLFKENRPLKENILIVIGLFVVSVAVGELVALLWTCPAATVPAAAAPTARRAPGTAA